MSRVKQLEDKGLISPPKWLSSNIHYETIMGSVAYGVSSDTSDMDIYGFCIPPKDMMFPQLVGEIPGFGNSYHGLKPKFNQYQQVHILDQSDLGGKGRIYDFQIYSIVKYFHLCMENNPNMIDSLFTPFNCILHQTKIGSIVREKRKIFLHKGAWHSFRGYAFSQLHKMETKNPEGKRKEIRDKFGFDVKFAYHIVRLLLECEQILTEGDIDLQKHNELLKSIRRGEWTEERIKNWFECKEKDMESLYTKSLLPWGPNKEKIKKLLLECLEEHYGTLEKSIITIPNWEVQAYNEILEIVNKYQTN